MKIMTCMVSEGTLNFYKISGSEITFTVVRLHEEQRLRQETDSSRSSGRTRRVAQV
jgi:hypothetical protein